MSAPVQNSNAQGTGLGGLGTGARPQLQSRRVSLKFGPFGLTYATDQVLWSNAAGAATDAAAAEAATVAAGLGVGTDQAQDASWTPAASQAPRSFNQELLDAWKRQAQERADLSRTYGPDAALRHGAEDGAADAEQADTSQAAGEQADSRTQGQQARAPASPMRRAIAAYLSCAGSFQASRSVLCAVA
jgi:hypothetical protein